MIEALIFDFDGLILDTEGPDYRSWREVYRSYGFPLPLSKWVECIGSADVWDVYEYLEELLGRSVDRELIRASRRAQFNEWIARQPLLPGVEEYIAGAQRLGLRLGLASSSSREWVTGHLTRLGLGAHFEHIRCQEDVARTKPDPALYLETLRALDVRADQAIALEDSLNGVLAAKGAGLFCVAVPNALIRHLDFCPADLRLDSLADLPLEDLLALASE